MPLTTEKVDPALILGLRARTRLNRAQFALKLLVHPITVWRWETARSRPSEVHLRQMRTLWGFSFGVQSREDS